MINNSKLPGWMVVVLRILIGALFIYAGATKAITPLRFATDIANFHLLPWVAAMPLAFYLPWFEIVCGAALLLSRLHRGAIFILLTLTFVFILALTSARIRGIDISCGCFGHAARDLSFGSHLRLNVAVLAVLLFLWQAGFRRPRA